jgi:chromosome segregation ATPase
VPGPEGSGSGAGSPGPGGVTEISAENAEFERLKDSFREDFRKNFNKIRVLGARKDLHDQLHELQFKFYNPVAETLEASGAGLDAAILEIVREHGFSFAEILDALREVVERNLLPLSDVKWVDEVADAYRILEKALSEADGLGIRTAVRAIRRVLRNWPTRINAKLNETAGELALAALAKDLHELCQKSSTFNLQLGDKVEKLRELDRQIADLATIHDNWQSFDDELELLEAELKQNFSELEEDWPFLKQKRATLYTNIPATWAQRLVYYSGKMDDALKEKKVEEAKSHFVRYRSAARERFYAADQDLKKGCRELEQVGEPIERVLKGV